MPSINFNIMGWADSAFVSRHHGIHKVDERHHSLTDQTSPDIVDSRQPSND